MGQQSSNVQVACCGHVIESRSACLPLSLGKQYSSLVWHAWVRLVTKFTYTNKQTTPSPPHDSPPKVVTRWLISLWWWWNMTSGCKPNAWREKTICSILYMLHHSCCWVSLQTLPTKMCPLMAYTMGDVVTPHKCHWIYYWHNILMRQILGTRVESNL